MTDTQPHNALLEFLAVWADPMLLNHIGPSLSCHETDALADLFQQFNHAAAAAWLISSHANADDPDDHHYRSER
jgi:hypothetical protein